MYIKWRGINVGYLCYVIIKQSLFKIKAIMTNTINGIHHITAIAGNAKRNFDFLYLQPPAPVVQWIELWFPVPSI